MTTTPILLHSPTSTMAPAGVWWSDGSGTLQRYYYDKNLQTIGEYEIGPAAAQADTYDVENFFDKKADSQPRPDVWDTATVKEMTPVEYLSHVRKQHKKAVARSK